MLAASGTARLAPFRGLIRRFPAARSSLTGGESIPSSTLSAARPSQARFFPLRVQAPGIYSPAPPSPGRINSFRPAPLKSFFRFCSVPRRRFGPASSRPSDSPQAPKQPSGTSRSLATGSVLRRRVAPTVACASSSALRGFRLRASGVRFRLVPRLQPSLRRSAFRRSGLPVHRLRRPALRGRLAAAGTVLLPLPSGDCFAVFLLLVPRRQAANQTPPVRSRGPASAGSPCSASLDCGSTAARESRDFRT